MKAGMVVRWLLSAVLAGLVWIHAHWSVALSLSFVFITLELRGIIAYHANAERE